MSFEKIDLWVAFKKITQEKSICKGKLQIITVDLLKKLEIDIAMIKHKIKTISKISYVGSSYGGHWETKGQTIEWEKN